MKIETWQHCYDDSWKGLITNDAFAHPAKMARGLVRRIFDELFAMNALRNGEVVLDPFGGVGTTGIEAASRGVQAYLVELEGRFVNFAEDNFVLHEKQWALFGKPRPIMLQGDSRKLRQVLLGRQAECVLNSPPYAKIQVAKSSNGVDLEKQYETYRAFGGGASFPAFCATQKKHSGDYGDSDGQLSQMPEGRIDTVVSSPPYNLPMSQDHNGKRGGLRGTTPSEQGAFVKYGNTEGQLEGMPMGDVAAVVSSPPYSGSIRTNESGSGIDYSKTVKGGTNRTAGREAIATGYGRADGQLGAMPAGEVDAVVSSPPYEGSSGTPSLGNINKDDWGKMGSSIVKRRGLDAKYGNTDGQIGHTIGETFWEAAHDIVLECYAALKPGGVAVWVVKDFVRDKKRVRFSADWIKLCEACGFKLIRHAHAMLVKETRTHDLFGEEIVKKVERKSFFRRLHEQKLPADDERRIDHEDVVFFVKN